MDRQVFILSHPLARRNAAHACAHAPDGYRVEIKERTRTSDQNAFLHALFSVVSKHAKWGGRTLTAEQWKVMFISGHAAATGIGSDMVPGLEGEFVNLRESSAQMSVSRMTSLIEYILAWCSLQCIDTSKDQIKYGFKALPDGNVIDVEAREVTQ